MMFHQFPRAFGNTLPSPGNTPRLIDEGREPGMTKDDMRAEAREFLQGFKGALSQQLAGLGFVTPEPLDSSRQNSDLDIMEFFPFLQGGAPRFSSMRQPRRFGTHLR